MDDELKALSEANKTVLFDKSQAYAPAACELCVVSECSYIWGTHIVLTSKLRPKTNALAHKGHLHVAIVGTKQNLRSKVW